MFFLRVCADRTRIGRQTVIVRSFVATEIVALLQSHGMRVSVQGGRRDAQRHDDRFVGSRRRSADNQTQDRQRVRFK